MARTVKKVKEQRPRIPVLEALLPSQTESGFSSPDEMIKALSALVNWFKGPKSKPLQATGLMMERLGVEFTSQVKEVELYAAFGGNRLVVRAPKIQRESIQRREARRLHLLAEFGPVLKDSQTQVLVQLYRSLNAEARAKLARRRQ